MILRRAQALLIMLSIGGLYSGSKAPGKMLTRRGRNQRGSYRSSSRCYRCTIAKEACIRRSILRSADKSLGDACILRSSCRSRRGYQRFRRCCRRCWVQHRPLRRRKQRGGIGTSFLLSCGFWIAWKANWNGLNEWTVWFVMNECVSGQSLLEAGSACLKYLLKHSYRHCFRSEVMDQAHSTLPQLKIDALPSILAQSLDRLVRCH